MAASSPSYSALQLPCVVPMCEHVQHRCFDVLITHRDLSREDVITQVPLLSVVSHEDRKTNKKCFLTP